MTLNIFQTLQPMLLQQENEEVAMTVVGWSFVDKLVG